MQGPFDYRIPAGQHDVQVGALLRVPFGGRQVLGVVMVLDERSDLPPERLAEPTAVLDGGLPADLVDLARWMAQEYCSTVARALGLLLAPGASQGVRTRQALVASATPAGSRALATPEEVSLTGRQRRLISELVARGATPAAELGTAALRRLEARGLVHVALRDSERRPLRHIVNAGPKDPPVLSEDQRQALAPVLGALARRATGSAASFLLHGVTGSGKTEVYLQAVQATVQAGRSAIVLVPEIALTPQTLARFHTRLGETTAVMHSGMSVGARQDEWRRLAHGDARVCVGPRSAVFAPLRDIGLIIVDEEHESSYKHEGDPRYDARLVAAERARMHGAVLLVGSATPRPESMHTLPRLRLPRRIDGSELPPVEILDMQGQHHPLHPQTRMALADLRHAGGKAIVLLNRRGWSNFLSCRSCGRVWMCPNCEVALVLHRAGGFVACHHCGHRERVPERCPDCASVAIARHGAGTERMQLELAEALGTERFPVLRLDGDASGLDARARTLAEFAAAPAGVLIGTQMVAKGHDFPGVGLGVVIDADATLRFPDFRAEERTFALVTQLAGRAGRGGTSGRVLVQSTTPNARSLRHAAGHDVDGFLAGELAHREKLGYPPFGSLIRIVCTAVDSAQAHRISAELQALFPPQAGVILGPAPLFRLRGRERWQLMIKSQHRQEAIEAVAAGVRRLAREASRGAVTLSVDVDPQ